MKKKRLTVKDIKEAVEILKKNSVQKEEYPVFAIPKSKVKMFKKLTKLPYTNIEEWQKLGITRLR